MRGRDQSDLMKVRDVTTRRVTNLVATILLECTLIVAHGAIVAPIHGYLGIPYAEPNLEVIVVLLAFSSVAAAALPVYLNRGTELLIYIIFFFGYAPAMTMAGIMGILTQSEIFLLQVSLTIGMCAAIIVADGKWPRGILNPPTVPFVPVVILLYFVLTAMVFAQNYGQMKVVSLADVYEQRFAGALNVGLSAYAMGFLAGAVNPFLMTFALYFKKYHLFLLGAFGQIIVYSVQAHKFVMLSILFIPALFFLLGARRSIDYPFNFKLHRVGFIATGAILLGVVFDYVAGLNNSELADQLSATLLMRTFSLQGGMAAIYTDYFRHYPVTLMSHVGIGRILSDSSGDFDVSQLVGFFMSGTSSGMNANAGTFVYDGIASFGFFGPLVVGVLIGAAMRVFSFLSSRRSLPLVAIATSPFAFSLNEGSFFTALLTGGGFLLMILIFLSPSKPLEAA